MAGGKWHTLEINGGHVKEGPSTSFTIPAGPPGYADAQIDDYGRNRLFRHNPDTTLGLRARFSHTVDQLRGTAGFGFWNSPYGDPSNRRLVLPQAVWFFFASPPNILPFAPDPPANGWFAATINAEPRRSLPLIPLSPFILALNQFSNARRRLWPWVRQILSIDAAPLPIDMTTWHEYRLVWQANGCRFYVDEKLYLSTQAGPRGPLGFVCWLDNQYLILTPRGRFESGLCPINEEQWLEVSELTIEQLT